MTENNEDLRWQKILQENPKAKKGMYNTERFKLLKPGVFVDASELTAASWMPTLHQRLKTQGKVLHLLAEKDPNQPEKTYRITIVEVGSGEKEGQILVESDSVQDWIHASIFAHCIKGEDQGMTHMVSNNGFGDGWAPPSGGDNTVG